MTDKPLRHGSSGRNEEFTFQKTRRAGGNNTDQERPEERRLIRGVPPVLKTPRRVRDARTRASDKRTLNRGVVAAREGTQQNVSFDSVSNW
ncbi:unnamed protein product [Ascophyllum nodosum]